MLRKKVSRLNREVLALQEGGSGSLFKQKPGCGRSLERDSWAASKMFWQTIRCLRRGRRDVAKAVLSKGGVTLNSRRWSRGGTNTFRGASTPWKCPCLRRQPWKQLRGGGDPSTCLSRCSGRGPSRRQSCWGGRDSPRVVKSAGQCRSVMVNAPLQCCMGGGYSTSGLANGLRSTFSRKGTRGCAPTTEGSASQVKPMSECWREGDCPVV